MTTEYPHAQKSGMRIVPIELQPTDKTKLQELFSQIPKSVKASDERQIYKAIKKIIDKNLSKKANDPKRTYLIGMAYMSGTDVEINREKGQKLLQEAASKGDASSMKKLSDMYLLGDGVVRNYNTALHWIGRYILAIKANTSTFDDMKVLAKAYEDEGNIWFETQSFDEALKSFANQCDVWADCKRDNIEA